jgi:hypothetical protein
MIDYKGIDDPREVEMCRCGHIRGQHLVGGGLAMGHGRCIRCECKKFTWVKA